MMTENSKLLEIVNNCSYKNLYFCPTCENATLLPELGLVCIKCNNVKNMVTLQQYATKIWRKAIIKWLSLTGIYTIILFFILLIVEQNTPGNFKYVPIILAYIIPLIIFVITTNDLRNLLKVKKAIITGIEYNYYNLRLKSLLENAIKTDVKKCNTILESPKECYEKLLTMSQIRTNDEVKILKLKCLIQFDILQHSFMEVDSLVPDSYDPTNIEYFFTYLIRVININPERIGYKTLSWLMHMKDIKDECVETDFSRKVYAKIYKTILIKPFYRDHFDKLTKVSIISMDKFQLFSFKKWIDTYKFIENSKKEELIKIVDSRLSITIDYINGLEFI